MKEALNLVPHFVHIACYLVTTKHDYIECSIEPVLSSFLGGVCLEGEVNLGVDEAADLVEATT